jgi:hypothetical protein
MYKLWSSSLILSKNRNVQIMELVLNLTEKQKYTNYAGGRLTLQENVQITKKVRPSS